MGHHVANELIPLQVAVMTVSDTRDESTDTSGQTLVDKAAGAGHVLNDKVIVKDDIYQIRAHLSR